MSNPLGKAITKNSGRRLAIGDIHGCLNTFKALITQIQLTSEDQLFLLGDYVNKGPNSIGVLDSIIELKNQFQIFPLLGNHDQMVLGFLQSDAANLDRLKELNSQQFFDLENDRKEIYINFISELHHYFILDNFLLVHAGFDFTLPNPFLGTQAMLNIREFFYDSSKAQGKTIVHGHFPHALSHIKSQIVEHNKILPLDNGCVYNDREDQGNLICIDLDTDELWIQPKVD